MLEGTSRIPPVGDVALRRQARKFHDADGGRRAQECRRNHRRVLPARFIIVGKDDDVPAAEVIQPFRIQVASAAPTRIAGRHQPPSFQGVNVLFPFGKIDGIGIEHFRKTIRDPLNTVQVPNDAVAPIGSALPEGFLRPVSGNG